MSDSNRRLAKPTSSSSSWNFPVFFAVLLPIALAAVVFRLEPFEPAEYPAEELTGRVVRVPATNGNIGRVWESVGKGDLVGPEDLVYDREEGVIYTGCWDGWIKRVTVNDSVVESLVNTGGRPLGLALPNNGELIVADSYKGLLRITKEGAVEVLTDEVDGLKFKLTDGVDVAKDGTIYFTDASYKYSFKEFIYDILEGKPHGRFISYDPSTKQTTLLASNLYFANGVAVSPDQQFVLFCETLLRRCKKYYIEGPKKGSIETFIADLPGFPDNIHYDGEGQYWIGLSSSPTFSWDLAMKYPFIRKALAIITSKSEARTKGIWIFQPSSSSSSSDEWWWEHNPVSAGSRWSPSPETQMWGFPTPQNSCGNNILDSLFGEALNFKVKMVVLEKEVLCNWVP
ncbi:protein STRICTOSIDINE SYNTHASE-LIKE 6-like [Senna tora]|uniref:Protein STRICTOSIDINE SYNTHASE-LIKE 6-like n=1 Tax=Senna tora TaxID=362788 RepID=A0A834WA53_9FABA|nr:protein STRICTOSIDINE SYNTHASE-LIKE 6-like [Senna tora]